MRVVELSTYREACGIASYTEALVAGLERVAGVGVEVLAPYLEPGAEERSPAPTRLWRRDEATVGQAWRTFEEARRRGAEVLHLQVNYALFSVRFLFALALLCHSARLPLFATLHGRGGGDAGRDRKMQRTLAALASAELIVHNEAHRAELPAAAQAHVIPHGVEPVQPAGRAELRRRLGIAPDRPVLAHFGFIHAHKGVAELIEAVAELRRRGMDDVLLLVCGGVPADETAQRCFGDMQSRIRALGLEAHIDMPGRFVPDELARQKLGAADWVVLNYRSGANQGTSGAARFALSSGRPVAVSRAALFDDLRAAAHTLEGELADELEHLLRSPDRARATLARAARFVESCAWPRIAERHVELFERALRARRA